MAPEFQTLLTTQIGWAITFFGAIALTALGAYLIKTYKEAKGKTPAALWSLAQVFLRQLVLAAEQAGVPGRINATGAEKKAYAIATAKAWLEKAGFKHVDVEQLAVIVEGLVNEFKGTIWNEIVLPELEGEVEISPKPFRPAL